MRRSPRRRILAPCRRSSQRRGAPLRGAWQRRADRVHPRQRAARPRLWRDAAAALATRGRAIIYDRRGFAERAAGAVRQQRAPAGGRRGCVARCARRGAGRRDRAQLRRRGRASTWRCAIRVASARWRCSRAAGCRSAQRSRRWVARLHERVFAAAEAGSATVGEMFLREVLGDAGWEALPDAVRDVFIANSPAIVAEERGGLLDASAERARDDRRCRH